MDRVAGGAATSIPVASSSDDTSEDISVQQPFCFSNNRPCCIRPGLYLSDSFTEKAYAQLTEHGITHVLQVGEELTPHYPHKFVYAKLDIADDERADLVSHFAECFNFIDEGRKAGHVLVHCYAGISRSATVVIAYLMWSENMTYLAARRSVSALRPCIWPNEGFVIQLQAFEQVNCQLNKLPRWTAQNWLTKSFGPIETPEEATTSGYQATALQNV